MSASRNSQHKLRYRPETIKTFFDAASVGIVPDEAEEYAAATEKRSNSFSWSDGVKEVKAGLGRLLSVPNTYLTLYHNTTAGVQRIFSRLSHLTHGRKATLLTTDIEYPGIMALADENWGGRLVVAQVADLIWSGDAHLVELVLKKSLLVSRPSVFYGSHVARASGFVLSSDFLRFAREVNPKMIVIIDGAQAAGNIAVDEEVLSLADFYVTSGHKWLNGRQTLGIVHAHESWKLDDPAQGYSAISGSRGTGSLGSLASLARSVEDINGATTGEAAKKRVRRIAEHNAKLAMYFSEQLTGSGLSTVGAVQKKADRWNWSGMVVALNVPASTVRRLEKEEGFRFSQLSDEPWRHASLGGDASGPRYSLSVEVGPGKRDNRLEALSANFELVHLEEQTSPVPYGGCTRLCFHYYHKKSDVDRLVKFFLEMRPEARNGAD